ncbi:MAG: hypothetical protein MZV65_52175 [Chromatiales bacterium]|nr:hypothetical protein [Chromatiales bacterium]
MYDSLGASHLTTMYFVKTARQRLGRERVRRRRTRRSAATALDFSGAGALTTRATA